jgi:long-chain acyl-CoA synthetase
MADTIPKLMLEHVRRAPEMTIQWSKDSTGTFQPFVWRQVLDEVEVFAAGLLDLRIKRGDHIGMISENMKEWLWSDMAILSIGAVDVPRGSDSMAPEILYILEHAECALCIVENLAQLEKVLSIKKSLKRLKTLIVLDPDFEKVDEIAVAKMAKNAGVKVLSFKEVQERGREYARQHPGFLEEEIAEGKPEDLATLIYTSGTTGEPKGVMLTHSNYMHQIPTPLKQLDIRKGDIFLSVLPVWHSYERAIGYVAVFAGCSVAYSKLVAQVMLEDMGKIKPQIFPSVPRIWEAVKRGIIRNIESGSSVKKVLAFFFISVGAAYSKLKTRLRGLRPRFKKSSRLADALLSILPFLLLAPLNALGQLLVFKKIKHRLGGKFKFGVSGAGALPPHVDEFFAAAGILLLEGYGLTETSPIVSVRQSFHPVPGTIGPPLEQVEVKVLAEDGSELPPGHKGVLYIRGPNVMKGYYKRPDLTEQTITPDGWLNTGDLAMLSYDGEIKIMGRVKETVVLLGGENVEPGPIEDTICESDYVDQVMVVGQDQKYLAALVVPNFETLKDFAEENGIPFEKPEDLLDNNDVYKLIMDEIDSKIGPKRGFKLFERINKIKILVKPFEKGVEMTHTLKLKRDVIYDEYDREIKELFKELR